jgi:lipopolysaccharide export system protein LptA
MRQWQATRAVVRVPGWVWILVACLAAYLLAGRALGQISGIGRGRNFVAPVTDAQGRKTVLRGEGARPVPNGLIELTNMTAETFRGQDKDMIFQAPQCLFNPKEHVAYSPGRLSIGTADGRFSLAGRGFRWELGDSGLSSKLSISNEVHSQVRKRLINPKTPSGPATIAATPRSPSPRNSGQSTNDFIDVVSRHFEYQSDLAVFSGQVKAHDEEGDLASETLKVALTGEGGALDRIEAEQDVTLQQGNARAIADTAVYIVNRDKEEVKFQGHAIWSDGVRQGSGERVIFDRRNRTLRAEEKAYLKLPRGALGEGGFLSVGNAVPSHPPDTNAFVEVFSDLMTMQLPPTNGPVQRIIAERSVLIVDPDHDGRALADRAEYDEATGLLVLSGPPILEIERRLINGKTIRFDRRTQVLSAGPEAYVQLPLHELAKLGLFPEQPRAAASTPTVTNWFAEIWSNEFEYRTNFLHFRGNVRANFLEGDAARGKLTCDLLTVSYGERVQSLVAEKDVEFEQFADHATPRPISRKISCPLLQARFTPAGHLEMAVAERGVTAEQEETRPGLPEPVFTTLKSETVTAFFSSITNRLDRMVAEKDVVFTQASRTAQGAKAVYTETNGWLELTGQPTATMPEGEITEAERLVWDRLHNRFLGKGKFKSSWKAPAGATNQWSGPTIRTK